MTKHADIEMMRSNIARSHLHVARQSEIICRLDDQGHTALAHKARELLKVMHGHLAIEIDMLDRLEKPTLRNRTAKLIGWHGFGA